MLTFCLGLVIGIYVEMLITGHLALQGRRPLRKGTCPMPLYNYQCTDCGTHDQRVAGLDDQFATCHLCGGRMIRTDRDPFAIELWDEEALPCES